MGVVTLFLCRAYLLSDNRLNRLTGALIVVSGIVIKHIAEALVCYQQVIHITVYIVLVLDSEAISSPVVSDFNFSL